MAADDAGARKAALEDLLDSLGSWMIGFIWPVAVGLVMEFYAILGIGLTHEWNTFIDRIGLLLVTAGVSGELLIEHLTHSTERKLRGVNAEIEEASDARLKAADERIALLDKEAAEARKEAADAQLRLEQYIARVAQVGTARIISANFAAALKNRPRATADLKFPPCDSEAYLFALQMSRVLKEEGWRVLGPTALPHSTLPTDPPPQIKYGSTAPLTLISKVMPKGYGENTAAGALFDAVREAIDRGLSHTSVGMEDARLPEDYFVIIVGQR